MTDRDIAAASAALALERRRLHRLLKASTEHRLPRRWNRLSIHDVWTICRHRLIPSKATVLWPVLADFDQEYPNRIGLSVRSNG